MPLDLSKIDSVSQIIEKITTITGHIDILINNGGISNRGTVMNTNLEVHMEVMQVNYFGTVAITKGICKIFVKKIIQFLESQIKLNFINIYLLFTSNQK